MSRRRAFTLIELLVVVAIIALLLAMLLPALSGAARSQRVKCQANLRTIGHAVQFYLTENRDAFPDAPFYGCLGYIGRSMYHALLGGDATTGEGVGQAKLRSRWVLGWAVGTSRPLGPGYPSTGSGMGRSSKRGS